MKKMIKALNPDWILDDEGIYGNKSIDNVKTRFSKEAQNELFSMEDSSWWFKYRAELIKCLVDKYFRKDVLTFDIGGGNGYTTNHLRLNGFCMGLVEPAYQACLNAKKRGVANIICGTVDEKLFCDGGIEQCILLDVLEHIQDDVGFLKLLHLKVKKGGVCLITVPAFMQLWSSEDTSAGHFRRYRLKDLKKIVTNAGFNVLYASYFFSFLYLPIKLIRINFEKMGLIKPADQRTPEEARKIMNQQFKEKGGIIDLGLSVLETIEAKIILKKKKIPFGSSIILIARN